MFSSYHCAPSGSAFKKRLTFLDWTLVFIPVLVFKHIVVLDIIGPYYWPIDTRRTINGETQLEEIQIQGALDMVLVTFSSKINTSRNMLRNRLCTNILYQLTKNWCLCHKKINFAEIHEKKLIFQGGARPPVPPPPVHAHG